ncbi:MULTISPECIES: hypothetical protein [Bacillota]|jgi:hypothetical protein|uniref:hypothetical protein n=1 Tax=Bacillota TaxID=1239 RepID=UPI002915363F|nr:MULTISPECIES: hypothetical protein [Bacillota]MDU6547631.1 hypothetical protein [Anaerococcus vaginalis]MDU6574250.1 hypothetical protein [Gemella haemolysans]
MDYKIDNDKIRLLQVKQTIDEVETLQELLNAEGHNFTFDEVLKLYAFNEINKKLEDIIPAE